MLNQNALPSQNTIPPLFFLGQRMIFGFLGRRLTVFVQVGQTLIACIRQDPNGVRQFAGILLEKLKIMFTAGRESRCDNFSGLWVSNQLCFLGMALLFAAVMPFLAFFGRSIGCSLASTRTTSKKVSLDWSACLPGKRNLPERTRTSSTFLIVRQTVASLIP